MNRQTKHLHGLKKKAQIKKIMKTMVECAFSPTGEHLVTFVFGTDDILMHASATCRGGQPEQDAVTRLGGGGSCSAVPIAVCEVASNKRDRWTYPKNSFGDWDWLSRVAARAHYERRVKRNEEEPKVNLWKSLMDKAMKVASGIPNIEALNIKGERIITVGDSIIASRNEATLRWSIDEPSLVRIAHNVGVVGAECVLCSAKPRRFRRGGRAMASRSIAWRDAHRNGPAHAMAVITATRRAIVAITFRGNR